MAVSKADEAYLSQAELARLKDITAKHKEAQAANNKAEMDKLHGEAEGIRGGYGYSGGAQGSEYNPFFNTNYAPMALGMGGQEQTGFQKSPMGFDNYYSSSGYLQQQEANKRALDQKLNQTIGTLEGQKGSINNSSDDLAREAYVSYMKSKNTLPQQLSAAGFSGGMADSQVLGLDTNLQNNQAQIGQQRQWSLADIDTAIGNARVAADIEAAEQAAQLAGQAVGDFNQFRQTQEQLAREELLRQQDIAREAAYRKEDLAYTRGRDAINDKQSEYERKVNEAKLAAEFGDFSKLAALGIDSTLYKNNYWAKSKPAMASSRASSVGGSANGLFEQLQQEGQGMNFASEPTLQVQTTSPNQGLLSRIPLQERLKLGYGPLSDEVLQQMIAKGTIIALPMGDSVVLARR